MSTRKAVVKDVKRSAAKPRARSPGLSVAGGFDPAAYADAAVLGGIEPGSEPFTEDQAAEIADVLLKRIAAELRDINALLRS